MEARDVEVHRAPRTVDHEVHARLTRPPRPKHLVEVLDPDLRAHLEAHAAQLSRQRPHDPVVAAHEAPARAARRRVVALRVEAPSAAHAIPLHVCALGLGLDDDFAVESLRALAARAAEGGTTVTVDMEESELVERTVTAFEAVQSEYGNAGIAVQSYLYRTPADLDRIVVRGGHVRLCKGAYAEPAEVAHQDSDRVDAAFDALTRRLMATPGVAPAIATHDMDRIELAKQLGERRSESWEFQMLYGVRTNLQRSIVEEGYPLRVYVPYGTAWYPYLTRRMAERPANLAFFLRAAVGR